MEYIEQHIKNSLIDTLKSEKLKNIVSNDHKNIIINEFINNFKMLQVRPQVKDNSKTINCNITTEKNTEIKIKDSSNCVKIKKNKCICRVWNLGLGTQCTRDKKNGEFCNAHYKKNEHGELEFGLITKSRPTHYSENCPKGKKPNTIIKWKCEEIKTSPTESNQEQDQEQDQEQGQDIEQDIEQEIEQEIEQDKEQDKVQVETKVEQDDFDDECNQLENKNLNFQDKNDLDEDISEIDIDDEIKLNGIIFNQYKVDESIIYIIDQDSKKVAEWDGINKNTIVWS
tara:strand:- start:3045 stop:3896 length:852 start_codon:yes stop_codon:yes gene_type:complete